MIEEPVNTKVLCINPISPEPDKIEIASSILRAGGLVAFPTETVYGIGAEYSNEKAKERLYQIKNRSKDKPFTLHISDIEEIERMGGNLSDTVRKLAYNFWPGPLTIVIESIIGQKLGFRMPRNRVALDLITVCGVPLITPSANLSGHRPALNAKEVMNTFNGKIEMILDGGTVEIGKESTVIDLTTTPYQLLREGAIPLVELERIGLSVITKSGELTSIKNILLVCTGNSCRSPMAEGWLKESLRLKGKKDISVSSAGISAIPGLAPAKGAEIIMKENGIDISGHRTRMLSLDMAEKADLILVMAVLHKEHIDQTYPEYKYKIHLLTEYGNLKKPVQTDIPDPVGRPLEAYEECLKVLKEHVERVANLL